MFLTELEAPCAQINTRLSQGWEAHTKFKLRHIRDRLADRLQIDLQIDQIFLIGVSLLSVAQKIQLVVHLS